MKIAISGKGGVGKTLLASLLATTFAESGYSVIAIDADPDANLASMLGFPNANRIVPISQMKELIEERTETKPGQAGLYFKINPRVDDLPEKYSIKHKCVLITFNRKHFIHLHKRNPEHYGIIVCTFDPD